VSNVVSLDDHRPHATGPVVCLACKHSWVATALATVSTFECPSCGLFKGIRQGIHEPPQGASVFSCGQCSGNFFWVMPGEVMCVACGNEGAWPSP
jgi:hypothetical protein